MNKHTFGRETFSNYVRDDFPESLPNNNFSSSLTCTDKLLGVLATSCPYLESVNVSESTEVGDEGARRLVLHPKYWTKHRWLTALTKIRQRPITQRGSSEIYSACTKVSLLYFDRMKLVRRKVNSKKASSTNLHSRKLAHFSNMNKCCAEFRLLLVFCKMITRLLFLANRELLHFLQFQGEDVGPEGFNPCAQSLVHVNVIGTKVSDSGIDFLRLKLGRKCIISY